MPDLPTPRPFDPRAATETSRRNLPHWRQEGAVYFGTFRLADSRPEAKLQTWRRERNEWLKLNPPPHTPEQHRQAVLLWDHRINEWLDAGHGSCVLADPAIGRLVEAALRHFDGDRNLLGDCVVMPNHVHALVLPLEDRPLSSILHSWKSYIAHEAARRTGQTGKLWQDETFDHIVRDEAAWRRFVDYIRRNMEHAPPGGAIAGCGKLTGGW